MDRYIESLKEIILKYFSDDDCKIFLFGSVARGDNSRFSDIDIGFISDKGINTKKFTLLREAIENLNIPYKVELVDFNSVSENFKIEALKNIIVWKE